MMTADLMELTPPNVRDTVQAAYQLGWAKGMVRAMMLAAQLAPDGLDYRLRRAFLDAMDACPPLTVKKEDQ